MNRFRNGGTVNRLLGWSVKLSWSSISYDAGTKGWFSILRNYRNYWNFEKLFCISKIRKQYPFYVVKILEILNYGDFKLSYLRSMKASNSFDFPDVSDFHMGLKSDFIIITETFKHKKQFSFNYFSLEFNKIIDANKKDWIFFVFLSLFLINFIMFHSVPLEVHTNAIIKIFENFEVIDFVFFNYNCQIL